MKNFPRTIAVVAVLAVLAFVARAQNPSQAKPNPSTWDERKAQVLTPLTAEQEELIEKALPAKSTVQPAKERRILVFYRCEGFVHKSITAGNRAIERLGEKTGAFSVEVADNYEVFTADNLAHFDAILFNNTTHLNLDSSQRNAVMDFAQNGKGIIGIHAASDNFGDWAEGSAMIGGQFNGHPWTANGTWAFKLDDPDHPLTAMFGKRGFWHQDEIYWYRPETYVGPEKLRILVSLDFSKESNRQPLQNPKIKDDAKFKEQLANPGALSVPVSWLRQFGDGRVFYTNLGHREETFWNPVALKHYLDGIQYALGDLEADATPTAKAGAVEPALAPQEP